MLKVPEEKQGRKTQMQITYEVEIFSNNALTPVGGTERSAEALNPDPDGPGTRIILCDSSRAFFTLEPKTATFQRLTHAITSPFRAIRV